MRLFAAALLLAGTVSAGGATLSGVVTDSTGAPLPGVTVEAAGPMVAVAVTASDGTYRAEVTPGVYDVSFRLINFASSVRRAVPVDPEASVDVTLYLSSRAEVVVTAKQTFRNLADMNEPVDRLVGFADAATVGVVTAAEIERRPYQRAGEILETVPGVIISQHSGEGKANQYYLRGFNLDHGTDVSLTVAGTPVNMPTHAHGQGYADANFLIPELIAGVQYRKGPYYAEEGDFSSAGAVNINYLSVLGRPIASVQSGRFGYRRALVAASPEVAGGYLLYAFEGTRADGPWERPDDLTKGNGILRYTRGDQRGGLSLTAMAYRAVWNATDQIPERAVGTLADSRFGSLDRSSGGETHRYAAIVDWQRNGASTLMQLSASVLAYRLDLFSNFTYFLDDPENGDQFEQLDERIVTSARLARRWLQGSRAEHAAGAQVRHDDIGKIALFRTRARERLDTVREDSVRQTSISGWAQSSVRLTEWLRAVGGIRADRYSFDVASHETELSGSTSASLLSPKLSLVLGPWNTSELYVNAGSGFHSNDGRGTILGVDPLVRTRGAELGARTSPVPSLHATAAVWALDIASELLFVGDAGTTEASRPSRRAGIELASYWNLADRLVLDAEYAWSRARFRDDDSVGNHVPGAPERIASVGLSLLDWRRLFGEVRYRHFGPRPLTEDGRIRSSGSDLVSARVGWQATSRTRLTLDVFNVLDATASDIDYFYVSRLPGEGPEGVRDVHFHPAEPRSFRVAVTRSF